MGLTGIIYAAIVVAWAVFLVPLALRRHDQATQKRSVERFSSGMRVLPTGGRRSRSGGTASPPAGADTVPSAQASATPEAHGATRLERFPSRAARKAAAARRRRVLRFLVAVTLFTGAASVAAVIPLWSPAVPVAIIVVFLAIARRQVRLANERYWQRAAKSRGVSSSVVRRSAPSEGSGSSDRAVPSSAEEAPTVDMPAVRSGASPANLAQQRVTAVPITTTGGSSLWDPLPITLPTYVDKPVAKRVVRKIEIGSPEVAPTSSAAPAKPPAPETYEPCRTVEHAQSGTDAEDDTPRAANA